MRLMVVALLAVLSLAGCRGPDGLRRQFVALRHLQSAEGRLMRVPRQTERAVAELDRALELLPDDPGLRERAGPAYVAARAWEKAIPLLREHADEDRNTRIMLAQCLLQTGRVEEGASICREVLREAGELHRDGEMSRPEFAEVLNNAGYVLAETGHELDRAEKAIEAAVEIAPLQGNFVDSLGWVLYQQGQYPDAAFYLERALRLGDRQNPEMLYHLGAAYARLGRLREAEIKLRKARWADPSWPEVQQELRRLGRMLTSPVMSALRPEIEAPAS